jgi:hypothetical protein
MKYPKTLHLPWSPGVTKADKIAPSIDHLINKQIVLLEKLDGECTSMFHDRIHARSEESSHHPSRSWVKGFWGEICHRIPKDVQIVGENMYAKHSIYYNKLDTYFYGFAAIKGNKFLGWVDTIKLFEKICIEPVPTLSFGPLTISYIRKMLLKPEFTPSFGRGMEGYVLRPISDFPVNEFNKWVLKYVRKDHVQTNIHWRKHWVKNGLKND